MYGNQLAQTGAAIVTIGGLALGGWHLLALAVLLVCTGALLLRFTFRRGRRVSDS
jgi:hypothetical protein